MKQLELSLEIQYRVCQDYVSIIVLTSIRLVLQIASNIIAVRHSRFIANASIRSRKRFSFSECLFYPRQWSSRSGYAVIKFSASSSFHLKDLLAKYVSEKYPAIAGRAFPLNIQQDLCVCVCVSEAPIQYQIFRDLSNESGRLFINVGLSR